MQGQLEKLQGENGKLKTYLSASLTQVEQYKLALKKLSDLNTQLEDDLTKRAEEINLLKSDNAQLQKDNDHLTSVIQ